MSILSGIGRAIRAPGFGDRLQAALAAAGGDSNAIPRLRALQLQQAELQRQNDARDAQVIGAKNLGFNGDEIGAVNGDDLSWLARQRIAERMMDPRGGEGEAGTRGGEGTDGLDAAFGSGPGALAPQYAPPPGSPQPAAFTQTAANHLSGLGASGATGSGITGLGAPRLRPLPALGTIPRVQNYAQAASLPKGSYFFAPNGSVREIV